MVGDVEKQPPGSVDSLTALGAMIEDSDEMLEESEEGEETEDSEAEDEGEGEERETEDDSEVFTVKVDGKEIQLTKAEVIARAQKDLDYTQKTMALADEKRVVSEQRGRAAEYAKQHEDALGEAMRRLTAYTQIIEGEIGEPPDLSLLYQDEKQYIAQKEIWQRRKDQLGGAYQQLQALDAEQARLRQARYLQKANETEQALQSTLPGWNDAMVEELTSYLGKAGIDPRQDPDAFVHKGVWELAHKARAYDELLAKKATLKPVEKLQKVSKPQGSVPIGKAAATKAALLENHKKRNDITSLGALL